MSRVAAGVLGVLMLAVYHLYRRRTENHQRVLPDAAVPMVTDTKCSTETLR